MFTAEFTEIEIFRVSPGCVCDNHFFLAYFTMYLDDFSHNRGLNTLVKVQESQLLSLSIIHNCIVSCQDKYKIILLTLNLDIWEKAFRTENYSLVIQWNLWSDHPP